MAIPVVAFGVGAAVGALLFGGDKVSFYAEFNQDVQNNIFQDFNASCKVECDNLATGTTIVIIDSTIEGGVYFNQKCVARAECSIKNTADSMVDNVLSSISEQSAFIQNSLISLGGSKLENNLIVKQRLHNQITQVLSASCQATSRNIARDTVLYVRNSDVKDRVEFTQNGVAEMNCSINNAGKIGLFNQVAAKGKQTATILSWAGGLALIVGVVVVLGILAFVLVTVIKGGGKKETPESSQINK